MISEKNLRKEPQSLILGAFTLILILVSVWGLNVLSEFFFNLVRDASYVRNGPFFKPKFFQAYFQIIHKPYEKRDLSTLFKPLNFDCKELLQNHLKKSYDLVSKFSNLAYGFKGSVILLSIQKPQKEKKESKKSFLYRVFNFLFLNGLLMYYDYIVDTLKKENTAEILNNYLDSKDSRIELENLTVANYSSSALVRLTFITILFKAISIRVRIFLHIASLLF